MPYSTPRLASGFSRAHCLPTPFIRNSNLRLCSGGFTLIEIVVVIFIIGIILTFAVLSVGQNKTRVIQDEVNRMNALMTLASQEAVLQGQEFAVEVHSNGYQFLQLLQNDTAWQWQPINKEAIFRPRCLPAGLTLKLVLEGETALLEPMSCDAKAQDSNKDEQGSSNQTTSEKEQPRIFLLSSGEMTPFQVSMQLEDEQEGYYLKGDLTGVLAVNQLNNRNE